MTEQCEESLSILGTEINVFESVDHVARLIRQRILSRRSTFCVAINPEKVYRAKCDPRLRQVLSRAQVRICDGVGISLASRLLYRKRVTRCPGIDLFLRLLRVSEQEGWKVFLLGASPQVSETARRTLAKTFPSLQIVGSRHGYCEDSAEVIECINRSGAELLFVAMGSPRQEFWIGEHMGDLNARFYMGIGGSLDVVSGLIRRAPAVFRRTGTEWLFRLLLRPTRLGREKAHLLFAKEILKAMRVKDRSSWTRLSKASDEIQRL